MANDSDSIVKILISLGLDDAGAKQAVEQINNVIGAAKEAGGEMTTLSESAKSAGDAEDDLTDKSNKSGESHRAMRRALMELNRVFPGLGEVANLAAGGFREMGESELSASAATEQLIVSLGPIAILLLSIQAGIEYWDIFKQHAKDALDAQTEAMKTAQEETGKALKAWQDYQDTISGKKDSVTKPFDEDLNRRMAEIKARNEGHEKELAAMQKKEEGAPGADKGEINQRYEIQRNRMRQNQDQEEQDARTLIISQMRDEVDRRKQSVADDQAGMHDAYQVMLRTGDKTGYTQRTEDITRQTEAIGKLTDSINSLTSQNQTAASVSEIKNNDKAAAITATSPGNETISQGVSSLFENVKQSSLGAYGKKITTAQQQHIQDLNELYEQIFGNTELLKEALTYAHQHGLNQQQEILLIKNQLETLSGQARSGGHPTQQ